MRERRPETRDSLRNSVLSVVSLQTHALALRRELGFGWSGQDSLVSPAISLLKEVLGELEPEAAADEKIYKKCQCNTNDRETTFAIDSGRQIDMDSTIKIEDKTAACAKLSTEAKKSDIAMNEATALRKK